MSRLEIAGDRRTGKSTMLVSHVAQFVRCNSDTRVLVVAPMMSNTRMLKDMLVEELKDLPGLTFTGDMLRYSGGYIKFISNGNSRSTHAQNVDMIAVDESEYVDGNLYEALLAMRQTLGTRWVETRGI